LQQLIWIFKNVPHLVAGRAQRFRGQLRRDLQSGNRSIFCDKSNFVDTYSGLARQRRFQLLRERTRLGIAARECTDKSRKLPLLQVWRKMNTRNAGSGEQEGETALTSRRTERYAIQKDLRSRCSQQQASVPAFIERRPQLFPGGFKLCHRAHMAEFIQPCKLQQNIQAANERACRRSSFAAHFLRKSLSSIFLLD
jgi:hypothetical protein